jgi:GT2 family glycosyltransferase
VVVDQSRTDATEELMRATLQEHDCIDYVRSDKTGAARARNEGASRADADLLLFVDDDCEVDPDWEAAWVSLFESQPGIGLVFGRVVAAPYNETAGIITTFEPGPILRIFGRQVLGRGETRLGPMQLGGMAANMAISRDAWVRTGGFDDHLGAGTDLPGGEETDLAVRVLDLCGKIGHAPDPHAVHHGFRAGSAAATLFHGYWIGTGAMYGKYIRSGDWRAIRWAFGDLWRLSTETVRKTLTGVRPTGFNAARFLVTGFIRSLRKPVDRTLRMYKTRGELTAATSPRSSAPASSALGATPSNAQP